jgi:hypothetical protein
LCKHELQDEKCHQRVSSQGGIKSAYKCDVVVALQLTSISRVTLVRPFAITYNREPCKDDVERFYKKHRMVKEVRCQIGSTSQAHLLTIKQFNMQEQLSAKRMSSKSNMVNQLALREGSFRLVRRTMSGIYNRNEQLNGLPRKTTH